MKVKTSTKSVVPGLVGGLVTAAASFYLGPVGLITFPLFWGLTKRRVARDVDDMVQEDVSQIVGTWKTLKKSGESTIKVSKTVPFGGLNLPVTREYTFSLERDE